MKKFAVLYMPDGIFKNSYEEAVKEAKRVLRIENLGPIRIVQLIATAQKGIEVVLAGTEPEFEIPQEWSTWWRRATRSRLTSD